MGVRKKKDYYKRIQRFRIIDDDFMRVVLKDKACTQKVLEIILNKPDLQVSSVEVQYDMKNLRGRSLELDVLATDSKKKKYNIEVQRKNKGASPKRARYHSALLDAESLEPGEDIKDLPENIVIFITEKDVLGGGKSVYHINRTVEETGKKFGDGAHIIYINAKIQDETPVGKLMHDFMCTRAEDMHYPVLADKVRYLKEDEKEVESMCKIMEEIEERGIQYGEKRGEKRGRKIGEKQGRKVGEKQGIDRVSKLVDILLSQNRIEDLQRSTSDRVYQRRLFQEFGI